MDATTIQRWLALNERVEELGHQLAIRLAHVEAGGDITQEELDAYREAGRVAMQARKRLDALASRMRRHLLMAAAAPNN